MPISFTRYIDVTSSEGGASEVSSLDLITRIFTTNALLPPQSYIEFETPEEVGSYFGTSGEEYNRAVSYFSWISKAGNSPSKISYARWVEAACAPVAFGDPLETDTLAQLQDITSGTFNVTIGSATANLSAINLSAAGSLAAVATILQTALDAVSGLSGTTVVYNSTTANFQITGATTGSAGGSISFSDTANTIGQAIGMLSPETILAPGSNVETIAQTIINSVEASNNFASFLFLTETNALTLAEYEAAAAQNITYNNQFMLLVPVSAANAATWSAALISYAGTALTLTASATDFAEMMPGKIMAATNYSNPNASQNFMFQQDSSLTPTVTTDAEANTYDALLVNYYGQTQINGQFISFYQRGFLMGGSTSPNDMTAYANEIWFKANIEDNIANLLLSLPELPANNAGRIQLMAVLQSSITAALFAGVISVGNTLSAAQKAYIQSITGDPTVAAQIQTIGYWINLTFSSYEQNGVTNWQANYQIIYAKSNAVRKVNGTHNLI